MSGAIEYNVAVEGNATPRRLQALIDRVDEIAEIPNSLRAGTPVHLRSGYADD